MLNMERSTSDALLHEDDIAMALERYRRADALVHSLAQEQTNSIVHTTCYGRENRRADYVPTTWLRVTRENRCRKFRQSC